MKTLLKIVFFWIAPVVIVLGGLVAAYALSLYPQAGPLAAEKIVLIESGSSARGIADTLIAEGVMGADGKYIFLGAARLKKSSLKAGEYVFPAGASIKDALKLLESGKTFQRQITVAEGLMSFEIVDIVNAAEALEGDVTEIPAQGTLLPETYSYTRGEDRNKIIARMKAAMERTVAELWEKRSPDALLATPEEAVILASIVEKETGVPSERAKVAGVFMNRLRQGMPLQTDPTVIYALTEGRKKLDRALLRKDLNVESPYNTYLHAGLPPGPIANPGRESIEAALNPEKHNYLYFVADGTGGHAFGVTLDDHLRNVAKWREINK